MLKWCVCYKIDSQMLMRYYIPSVELEFFSIEAEKNHHHKYQDNPLSKLAHFSYKHPLESLKRLFLHDETVSPASQDLIFKNWDMGKRDGKILINTFILLRNAKYTQEYSNDVSMIYQGLFYEICLTSQFEV